VPAENGPDEIPGAFDRVALEELGLDVLHESEA
jgi:hypothetical protein